MPLKVSHFLTVLFCAQRNFLLLSPQLHRYSISFLKVNINGLGPRVNCRHEAGRTNELAATDGFCLEIRYSIRVSHGGGGAPCSTTTCDDPRFYVQRKIRGPFRLRNSLACNRN